MKVSKYMDMQLVVMQFVKEHPDSLQDIIAAAVHGQSQALDAACERAATMEAALAVAVASRWKNRDSVLKKMIAKLGGKTSINWDGLIPGSETQEAGRE